MMYKSQLFLIFVLIALTAPAQKIVTVEAEYTYVAPENLTPEQARRVALERAQIKAIADEFGSTVTQTNLTNVSNENGNSEIDFQSIGLSEVKGEWIETIGEPKYSLSFEQGVLVVKVMVKGKARELITAGVDCVAKLLRNGKEDKFESSEFTDGDQIFLSFRSPAKGNIAVYLLDNDGQAFCLLPYPMQQDSHYFVKANDRHLLFDSVTGDEFTEEYYLTCSNEVEHNQLYVIFSPNEFTKALDDRTDELMPRELSAEDFQKWLAKNRRRDKDMQLIKKTITIKKR